MQVYKSRLFIGGSVAEWFVRWTTKLAIGDPGSIPGSGGTTDCLFRTGW